MNAKALAHGSFTIERTFRASAQRVFSAWCDVETKARWFMGPPDSWKLVERAIDFRVGGSELLKGELSGGKQTLFECRYHEIIPDRRIVYAYDMHHGDAHLSVSLASVELSPVASGTLMKFTEQAVFLDGEDGTASRERGTAAHFDRLVEPLEDPRDIVSARTFEAPPAEVFAAFADPERLARFWGPLGFTSTFHSFDFRPGGAWRFTMRGPDGTEYPNAKDFVEVRPAERLVFRHVSETHGFTMTMTFVDLGRRTYLTWRMRFDSDAEARAVRDFIVPANEQNFDRLAAHLEERA